MAESLSKSSMISTTETIGELLLQNNKPLLKMWNVTINGSERPFEKHSHTRFEITVVNSGSGEYTTETAVFPMLPGDVFVFSSNEAHCITKSQGDGLSITNLHFEPRYLLENNHNELSENFINFCFSHSNSFENRIPCENATFLRQNYSMIKQELLNRDKHHSVAITSYLNLILIDLLRNHNYQSESLLNKPNNLFNLLAVYDYIDAHLEEELNLHDLACIAGFSPNYFSHVFKQLNGISLWDYITAKRIEKATKLITSADSNQTMLDIALKCGFNNTVNFNKAFKKHKGITPNQLKKNPKILSH